MIEQRKNFIINSIYVALWAALIFVGLRFTFDHLMPFVVGFMIAAILKPAVRKLDDRFGKNKWVSILVTVLFYGLILFALTGVTLYLISLVQTYIPQMQKFAEGTIMPMANEMIHWFENLVGNLDPSFGNFIERGLAEMMNALVVVLDLISKSAVSWVTNVVASTPKLLVSILLAVISSFFFSMDYEEVVDQLLMMVPRKARLVLIEVNSNFTSLIKKYFVIYGKLLSITFIELSIGFLVLRVKNPFGLALLVAVMDILPVLGTGTVLIPWTIYELILGNPKLAIGLFVLYALITAIRYALEPRIIGKEMGLHPLLTLVSIYIGLKFFGFVGLFGFPIAVTIVVNMHKENKFSFLSFFKGEWEDAEVTEKE